jgi:dTDP-4-amino-4,6-dideoxygalactose transaminase
LAEIRGSVANAEKNAATCLSLPMFPEITDAEVDTTIAELVKWDKANK